MSISTLYSPNLYHPSALSLRSDLLLEELPLVVRMDGNDLRLQIRGLNRRSWHQETRDCHMTWMIPSLHAVHHPF